VTAAERDVLSALAADEPVLVEVGHVWACGRLVADENTARDLQARGLVAFVGAHLQITARGRARLADVAVAS